MTATRSSFLKTLLAIAIVAIAGCGGSSENSPKSVVADYLTALNNRDADAICKTVTDNYRSNIMYGGCARFVNEKVRESTIKDAKSATIRSVKLGKSKKWKGWALVYIKASAKSDWSDKVFQVKRVKGNWLIQNVRTGERACVENEYQCLVDEDDNF